MQPTTEILVSSPVSGAEATALRDLVFFLPPPALILANFEVNRGVDSRQIDFVVITPEHAELIELKNLTAPVKGDLNGPWRIEISPGAWKPYDGQNPWEQAKTAKLALSDAMREYARTTPNVPAATRQFFHQFEASVAIYPELCSGSQVPTGNIKAWVRSFPRMLDGLVSRRIPSTWGISECRNFATEHLGLVPVALSAAIDRNVFQADQRLQEYATRLQCTDIAPLLMASSGEIVGPNVLNALARPGDVLLLGRSGLGKSFHLEHYRRRCLGTNEVPVLLFARYYQRDLNRAIHKSIGQFTALTPGELLDAIKLVGKRPVLLVDGWNDCPPSLERDLSDDLGAFQLRYNAKLVTASHTLLFHSVFASAEKVELAPLGDEHKQAIFSFYAGQHAHRVPLRSYEPFSTAFDLSIAGRCHTAKPNARAGLNCLTRTCGQ